MNRGSRVLIATSAHHPEDGRLVRHCSLLESDGIEVSIAAGQFPSRVARFVRAVPWLISRLRSLRPDAVILPDPELFVPGVLAARLLRIRAVIDIHEDYALVARNREWIPRAVAAVAAVPIKVWVWLGRWLSSASIVAAPHLARRGDVVVVNHPLRVVPRSEDGPRPELVYVGAITRSRGAFEMVELAALTGIPLVLVGPVAEDVRSELIAAASRLGASVELTGRLSYQASWERAAGALFGLSLLHDVDAYRPTVPTKVYEYMAHGVPVLVSDLPAVSDFVVESGAGWVVRSLADAAEVVQRVMSSDEDWRAAADRGGAAVARILGSNDRHVFVDAVLGTT